MEVLNKYFFLLPLLFVVVPGLIMIAFYFYREKKRKENLKIFAKQNNFNYAEDSQNSNFTAPSTPLFQLGRRQKRYNILSRKTPEMTVTVFDYRYTSGSGKHSSIKTQTVICLESDKLNLPSFSLHPENFFHKVVSHLGYQDIDFTSDPQFSKMYLLHGKDEQAIRIFFDSNKLKYFRQNKGLCLEATKNKFILYRQQKLVSLDKIKHFIENGITIYQLFT